MSPPQDPVRSGNNAFDDMMTSWFPLTYLLNNLNRGLGLPDGYPFVLSALVIDKLRFVHETVVAKETEARANENLSRG